MLDLYLDGNSLYSYPFHMYLEICVLSCCVLALLFLSMHLRSPYFYYFSQVSVYNPNKFLISFFEGNDIVFKTGLSISWHLQYPSILTGALVLFCVDGEFSSGADTSLLHACSHFLY